MLQLKDENGFHIQTVLPTAPFNLCNVLISLIALAIVIIAELFYGKAAVDYSNSTSGI